MGDISRWISHRADWSPAKTAVRFRDRQLSYGDFDRHVDDLAAYLEAQGIGHGERVAHLGHNSDEQLALLFACARIGAIMVPLNWRLAGAELAWIVNHCTPRLLLIEDHFAATIAGIASELPKDLRQVRYDGDYQAAVAAAGQPQGNGDTSDALMIVYTSGTTGKPKGAVLRQSALFYNALNAVAAQDIGSDDHILTVLPMFHVGGMNIQTTPALYAGATVTIHDRFDPGTFLRAVEQDRPSMSLLVPAAMQAVSAQAAFATADLSSLKFLGTGSSTVPEALIRPWQERGVAVTQVYGLTESAPVAICLSVEDSAAHTGSCGKAVLHCAVRIADDDGRTLGAGEKGEILLQGQNLLSEYWRDPHSTTTAFTDGWFHTGDVGHVDEQGFFFVDDRKKDVVISGGENIYPAELENVLADCGDLAEWAVIGQPDPRWVEIPVACVVRATGSEIDEVGVLALFRDRLARYKHPKRVVFLDQLPRTALGKVQKFELRKTLDNK